MANYSYTLILTNTGGGTARRTNVNINVGDTLTVTVNNGISGVSGFTRANHAKFTPSGSQTYSTSGPDVATAASTGVYQIFYSKFGNGQFKLGSISGTISAAASPTYSITAPTSISEGSSGTVNIATTNVSNGTTLYWSMAPSAEVSTSQGSVSISNNAASFTASVVSGDGTENQETVYTRLFSNSTRSNQVAFDSFVIPANTESGGGGGGGTGGGTSGGSTAQGINVFSQNGTKVFGTDLRTQNVQYEQSVSISGNSTSSTFSMADANDSTKVLITILGHYPPSRFTINTSSTGFSITNNTSSTQTANLLALRIG